MSPGRCSPLDPALAATLVPTAAVLVAAAALRGEKDLLTFL